MSCLYCFPFIMVLYHFGYSSYNFSTNPKLDSADFSLFHKKVRNEYFPKVKYQIRFLNPEIPD